VAVTTDLYDRLMALNREAFAAGSYEVAYHALAAALHCAIDLEASQLLSGVAQRANPIAMLVAVDVGRDPAAVQAMDVPPAV
jgi:hypothetical protein